MAKEKMTHEQDAAPYIKGPAPKLQKKPVLNFEEDANAPGDLTQVIALAKKMKAIQTTLDAMAVSVAKEVADLKKIQEIDLPEAMREAGVKSLKLEDGDEVSLKKITVGNIPSFSTIEKESDPVKKKELLSRRIEAFKYLRDHGADSLIKSEVIVSFDKGDVTKANGLVEALRKKGLTAGLEVSVHAQTFNSWIRERIDAGEKLPLDTFKIQQIDRAEIKTPKTTKAKAFTS